MRGTHRPPGSHHRSDRFIPGRAGNTSTSGKPSAKRSFHSCPCGVHIDIQEVLTETIGSLPHVRRTQQIHLGDAAQFRQRNEPLPPQVAAAASGCVQRRAAGDYPLMPWTDETSGSREDPHQVPYAFLGAGDVERQAEEGYVREKAVLQFGPEAFGAGVNEGHDLAIVALRVGVQLV